LDILHYSGPRRPAHPVLVIPTRNAIRDHKTDDNTFGGGFWHGFRYEGIIRTQHRQHDVRDSNNHLRAQGDHGDSCQAQSLSSRKSLDDPYQWQRGCASTQPAISSKTIAQTVLENGDERLMPHTTAPLPNVHANTVEMDMNGAAFLPCESAAGKRSWSPVEERRARRNREAMMRSIGSKDDGLKRRQGRNGGFICTSIYVTPTVLDPNKRIPSDRAAHPLIDCPSSSFSPETHSFSLLHSSAVPSTTTRSNSAATTKPPPP
jgi:hypothetical protein